MAPFSALIVSPARSTASIFEPFSRNCATMREDTARNPARSGHRRGPAGRPGRPADDRGRPSSRRDRRVAGPARPPIGEDVLMWIAPERRSLSRWAVPGLVLGAGVVVGAVLAADGRDGTALIALAALAGYAGYLAYRRNEPALPLSEGFGSGHRARTHLRAA